MSFTVKIKVASGVPTIESCDGVPPDGEYQVAGGHTDPMERLTVIHTAPGGQPVARADVFYHH
jgi:hypothetical protein